MSSKFRILDKNGTIEIDSWNSNDQSLYSYVSIINAAVAKWDEVITNIPGNDTIDIKIYGDKDDATGQQLGTSMTIGTY